MSVRRSRSLSEIADISRANFPDRTLNSSYGEAWPDRVMSDDDDEKDVLFPLKNSIRAETGSLVPRRTRRWEGTDTKSGLPQEALNGDTTTRELPSWTHASTTKNPVVESVLVNESPSSTQHVIWFPENKNPTGILEWSKSPPRLIVGSALNAAPYLIDTHGASEVGGDGAAKAGDNAHDLVNPERETFEGSKSQGLNLRERLRCAVASVTAERARRTSRPSTIGERQDGDNKVIGESLEASQDGEHNGGSSCSRRLCLSFTSRYPLERAIYEVKRVLREDNVDFIRRKNCLKVTFGVKGSPDSTRTEIMLKFIRIEFDSCIVEFQRNRKVDFSAFADLFNQTVAKLQVLDPGGLEEVMDPFED